MKQKLLIVGKSELKSQGKYSGAHPKEAHGRPVEKHWSKGSFGVMNSRFTFCRQLNYINHRNMTFTSVFIVYKKYFRLNLKPNKILNP